MSSAKAGLRILGILAIAVATVWLYSLWRYADPFVRERHLMSLPIAFFFDAGALFGAAPSKLANPAPPEGTKPIGPQKSEPESPPRRSGDATERAAMAQRVANYSTKLMALRFGWEGLTTLTGLWLVMGGAAAAFGAYRSTGLRALTGLCAMLVLAGTVVYTLQTWRRFDWGWEFHHIHQLVILLGGFCLFLGASLSRGGRRSIRSAAWMLILATAGTLAAVYWGDRLSAFEPGFVTGALYGQIFVAQSAFAWIILLVTRSAR